MFLNKNKKKSYTWSKIYVMTAQSIGLLQLDFDFAKTSNEPGLGKSI